MREPFSFVLFAAFEKATRTCTRLPAHGLDRWRDRGGRRLLSCRPDPSRQRSQAFRRPVLASAPALPSEPHRRLYQRTGLHRVLSGLEREDRSSGGAGGHARTVLLRRVGRAITPAGAVRVRGSLSLAE